MMQDDELFSTLRAGDRAALGRAITLVESGRSTDSDRIRSLVERCLPYGGNGLRLGVTGIPGAGKSTLIDALGMRMIGQGHRVAVLAIDPSSERSGGSILGDKTRMERLSVEPQAFIRPSPAGGNLGGVARRTREAIALCEAAGYDRILVETVGAGQGEFEVDHVTDLNLLLLIAGTGDELQGIKRGIMESADLIAFTKAEGAMAEKAEAARRELRSAVALLPARDHGGRAEIHLTSALTGAGIAELGSAVERLFDASRSDGTLATKRSKQLGHWFAHDVDLGLRALFDSDPQVQQRMPGLLAAVEAGDLGPYAAAEEILRLFRTGAAPPP